MVLLCYTENPVMPCFSPLKDHLLMLSASLMDTHGIKGTFLEIGCGDGFFTEFLSGRGLSGKAIDLSARAVSATRNRVSTPDIVVRQENFMASDDGSLYDLILFHDVLEHVQNDCLFLSKISESLTGGGAVLCSFPVKMREWRWDDDNYGHYRRYEPEALHDLFADAGLCIVVVWDMTFPFIWLMRRVYTRFLKPPESGRKREKSTEMSAFESSAGSGLLMRVAERVFPWKILFRIQDFFREKILGCNVLVLARKGSSIAVVDSEVAPHCFDKRAERTTA